MGKRGLVVDSVRVRRVCAQSSKRSKSFRARVERDFSSTAMAREKLCDRAICQFVARIARFAGLEQVRDGGRRGMMRDGSELFS